MKKLRSILLDRNGSSSTQNNPEKKEEFIPLEAYKTINKVRKFFLKKLKEDSEFRLIF